MPLQPLDKCVNEVVKVLRTVSPFTNEKQVPLNPPSMMSYSNFALTYPFSGNLGGGPTGTRKSLHNIAIDVLTKDLDLARATQTLRPLVDTVSIALHRQISYDSDGNPGQRFNNSISTFVNISYSWIPQTDFGGVALIGYHFVMEDIKILVSL